MRVTLTFGEHDRHVSRRRTDLYRKRVAAGGRVVRPRREFARRSRVQTQRGDKPGPIKAESVSLVWAIAEAERGEWEIRTG